ncbi:MAG: LysM peptidoglycan-binding domain-containing protein [Balneolaceae bacterium]
MNNSDPLFFRFIKAGMLILAFLLISDTAFSQSGRDTHVVQSGETLYRISQQHDVTVTEIREWNNLENNDLQTGLTLYVSPPESREAVTHTVAPGETLFSVSRTYNVTIAEIQEWNRLDSTVLSEGQELIIHATDREHEQLSGSGDVSGGVERESMVRPVTAPSTYYTVKTGDYLNRIANEHGMTTDELRRLNNLENDMLSVGQRLIVRESRSTPVVDDDLKESTPQGRFVSYRLETGENKTSVLERFSMTEEELEALNPGSDIESLSQGQRITILLPATTVSENPYRKQSGLQDLGDIYVSGYSEDDMATTTTSGELYNPDQLTAAHSNIALGSVIFIENPENGRGTYVKINDRFSGDGIKLSRKTIEVLGFESGMRATASIYQEN